MTNLLLFSNNFYSVRFGHSLLVSCQRRWLRLIFVGNRKSTFVPFVANLSFKGTFDTWNENRGSSEQKFTFWGGDAEKCVIVSICRASPLKIRRARLQRPPRKPRRKSNHQASSEARRPPAGARGRASPPRGDTPTGRSTPRLLQSTHTRLIIIIQKVKRCCAYPRYIIR